MADEKVAITKLELTIAGEKIKVTVEQAKALKRALEDLFGNPAVTVKENFIYWPYPTYTYKYERTPWKSGDMQWTISNCSSGNDILALSTEIK